MKILESYKKIAKSMLIEHAWDRKFGEPLPTLEYVMKEAEVDDEKMIKYKDKDGEQKQMKAGSAKTMDKEHPAKQAWDKMADTGDEEKPKSKGAEPSDFERDFDDSEPEDKPFGGDTGKDADSETGKDYVSKFQGTDEPEGGEPSGELEDEANDILDTVFTDVDTGKSDIPHGENLAFAAKQISKISGAEFTDELQKNLEDFEDLDLEDDDDYSPGELNRIKATEANKIKKQLDQHIEDEIKGLKKTGGKKEETILINGKKYKRI